MQFIITYLTEGYLYVLKSFGYQYFQFTFIHGVKSSRFLCRDKHVTFPVKCCMILQKVKYLT